MSDALIVFVTAPNRDDAARIADSIVSERLAACVNIVAGVESIYWWEGSIERDQESLLIIKTTTERYADLERRVKELHTYTTPEVIAIRIERGAAEYLKWVQDSTTREQA